MSSESGVRSGRLSIVTRLMRTRCSRWCKLPNDSNSTRENVNASVSDLRLVRPVNDGSCGIAGCVPRWMYVSELILPKRPSGNATSEEKGVPSTCL